MIKKDLEKVYPKDNVYVALIYAFTMFAILFGLNWYQVLIAIGIDSLAFILITKPDLKFFYSMNPALIRFKNISQYVDTEDSLEKQNEFFELLSIYPEKRSLDIFFVSLVKVLPVGLYISFISETSSFWGNLALFYLADLFILFYVSGLLFIQLHDITSEIMSELRYHEKWKENYRDLRLSNVRDRFSKIQNILLVVMLINLFCLMVFIMKTDSVNTNYYVFFLFASALVGIGKIQLLFQKFFKKSLMGAFQSFNTIVNDSNYKALPLHTSPMISGFEYSFNQLGLKLEEREKEISQWLKHESEQFHLRTLGEVTAMVAHDMKTPLNVMSMSLDMMNNSNTTEENRTKYKEMLERNLALSISFSKTLMAYVRGNKGEETCKFGDIHRHLLDLFKTQFNESELASIRFNITDDVKELELAVNRLDAMHIFYNLYQNALKSVLLDLRPSLSIWCETNEDMASIAIHNSGPSLSAEVFNNLISFERFRSDNQFYHGLGLRLTNSILGHLKGKLELIPVNYGTCLKVSLPYKVSTQLPLKFEPIEADLTVQ